MKLPGSIPRCVGAATGVVIFQSSAHVGRQTNIEAGDGTRVFQDIDEVLVPITRCIGASQVPQRRAALLGRIRLELCIRVVTIENEEDGTVGSFYQRPSLPGVVAGYRAVAFARKPDE